jgi:hypothetical protein
VADPLDYYRRRVGGEAPAGYGRNALGYLDDVLAGRQPYEFDRGYALPPEPEPLALPQAPGASYLTFADKLGIDTDIGIARTENVEPTNDWTRFPNGEAHLSRLSARYGPSLLQRMDDHKRAQLEPLIRREIAKAIEARGKGGGPIGNAAQGAGQEPASQGLIPGGALSSLLGLIGGGTVLAGGAAAAQPPVRYDPLQNLQQMLGP